MARSYDIRDLITLPRLDASSADALVTELLTCAKGKSLAAPVESARKSLAESQAALKGALTSRIQLATATESADARMTDQAEDAAFSATYDWLSGFSKLPVEYEEAALAVRLLGVLFREGLKFTQLPFKLEWAEADARLRAIKDDPSLEGTFARLGGEIFLKNLRKAHKEYGDAVGITTVKAAEATMPAVKEPLMAVRKALRSYALQVLAHSDEDAGDLAEALLAPLATWQSPAVARTAKATTAPAPAVDTVAPDA